MESRKVEKGETTEESNGKNTRCVMGPRNLLFISLAPLASFVVYLSLKEVVFFSLFYLVLSQSTVINWWQ